MRSKEMRENILFMRNSFETSGKWGIPIVRKEIIEDEDIDLIACSDTKSNDSDKNTKKGVHFFVDDYRFKNIYENPEKSLKRYSQYKFLLTPDFSTYADMNLWRQLESVAKNRWVGAYWQSKGLKVIPSISWSGPRSYEFCFEGIEKNATVAIGMIGCKRYKLRFMDGYNKMLEKIKPEKIIVLGKAIPEMMGNVHEVDYLDSRRVVR